jgi:hypothetical protein
MLFLHSLLQVIMFIGSRNLYKKPIVITLFMIPIKTLASTSCYDLLAISLFLQILLEKNIM